MIVSRDAVGTPVVVGHRGITLIARSFTADWRGWGFLSNRPAAVIVEEAERTVPIPIRDLSARIVWAIGVGAAALVAAYIARDRRRRESDD